MLFRKLVHGFFLAAVIPASLSLGGCLMNELYQPEPVKNYSISLGDYYSADELAIKPRDSANFESFLFPDTSAVYLRKNFPTDTGTWYVDIANPDRPKLVVEMDSRILYTRSIRNIGTFSFETCDQPEKLCFLECPYYTENPGDECYKHVSSPADSVFWRRYVKFGPDM